MRHKILTVLIVIIAVAVVASAANGDKNATKVGSTATSSTSPSTSPQTTFKVGDKISFDSKVVTVTSIERNWSSGNQYIVPDSGNEFIKAAVTIENDSNNQISYNTFDWKIKTSQGVIKDVDGTAFTVDGALNSGELAPKGTVSGFLVFQVPSGDNGLKLQYSPSFWTDKTLEITL